MIKNSITQALMNASSDLAIIIDPEGLIIDINNAALRRFNLTSENVIDKSLYDLLPANFIDFRKVYIDIVLQSNEPHRFEDEYQEFFYHACIYPLVDDNTNKIQHLAIFCAQIVFCSSDTFFVVRDYFFEFNFQMTHNIFYHIIKAP